MIRATAEDHKFMRRAITEARKSLGQTSPNPAVGAVIAKGGRILAAGHHQAAGKPHAEIEAIRALKSPRLARGATIYVTLEPCSTHGRTPPCTEAILERAFARVVYGATDPNPSHAGRAARLLGAAGVEVTAGILSKECLALNAAWNHWILTGMPYVTAKCGMSLDGRIGSHPESRWITGAASRHDAMQLRAQADAILIGGGTLRTDDPMLSVRLPGVSRQPWRVVWTQSGRLPRSAKLFTDSLRDRTIVFEKQSLRETLLTLGKMDVTSVLIEGGGKTLGMAFDAGLVNRAVFYMAPQFLGGPVPAIGGIGVGDSKLGIPLRNAEYEAIDGDVKISGEILQPTI